MRQNSRILVTGHRGLVGSAVINKLKARGYTNLITSTKEELDLTNGLAVHGFFENCRPEYVFSCAARVGGINFNKEKPADILRENIQIETNMLHNSAIFDVKKFCFIGSASCYPFNSKSPINETSLFAGPLNELNLGYSMAKIAGYTMCKQYEKQYGLKSISVFPNNIYGPNDNFDEKTSHAIPALIARIFAAKEHNKPVIEMLGGGDSIRDFTFSLDLADALVYLMEHRESSNLINVSSSECRSLKEVSEIVRHIIGFTGKISWNTKETLQYNKRFLDCGQLDAAGWKANYTLEQGLAETIKWYIENRGKNV